MSKVLFILKYRQGYGTDDYSSNPLKGLSSGLFNSARFVCDMLNDHGIESKLVQVIDNNCIDKEVHQYKPTHVIIEAYWVVPEKFKELTRLHPNVTWIIRNHSELSFLANEGIALGWTLDYLKYPKVVVSSNSLRTNNEMKFLAKEAFNWTEEELDSRVVYLPNYYPAIKHKDPVWNPNKETLDIGCFGAVRPLKNHLIQAVAAMEFADSQGKNLNFHINVGRVEGRGEPILKNLREMFDRMPNHNLIEHGWMPHHEFTHLIRSMDMGLQVSFTESFNIVAADFVNNNVPIIVSPEVFWASEWYWANPTSTRSMVKVMKRAWFFRKWLPWYKPSFCGLLRYDRRSVRTWIKYFK